MIDENEEVEVEETLDTPDEELEVIVEEEDEEDVESLKAQLAKAKEYGENQKIRAEKAEKKPKVESTNTNLSTTDLLALAKSNIEEEDLDDVMEYAKFKNISIAEALKSNVIKATLTEKAEFRKTAQATNTGSTRKGTSLTSDERLLSDARAGNLPSNDEEIARLALLKFKKK